MPALELPKARRAVERRRARPRAPNARYEAEANDTPRRLGATEWEPRRRWSRNSRNIPHSPVEDAARDGRAGREHVGRHRRRSARGVASRFGVDDGVHRSVRAFKVDEHVPDFLRGRWPARLRRALWRWRVVDANQKFGVTFDIPSTRGNSSSLVRRCSSRVYRSCRTSTRSWPPRRRFPNEPGAFRAAMNDFLLELLIFHASRRSNVFAVHQAHVRWHHDFFTALRSLRRARPCIRPRWLQIFLHASASPRASSGQHSQR